MVDATGVEDWEETQEGEVRRKQECRSGVREKGGTEEDEEDVDGRNDDDRENERKESAL